MVKSVTTLSSREFNRDIERAKQATRKGPQTLADLLSMPGAAEVEFEPARWREPLSKRFEL